MFGCDIAAIFRVGPEQKVPPRPEIKPKKLLTGLMLAGSASAMSLSLAASEAHAQALPAGCSSDGTIPGTAQAGDTVTCVEAAPGTIDGISTNVDDLTIVVGDATTPTTVSNPGGDGIAATTSGGDFTLNGKSANVSAASRGVSVYTSGGDIFVSDIDSIASTSATSRQFAGLRAVSEGGDVSVNNVGNVGGVTSASSAGISIYANRNGGGNIDIGTISPIGDVFGTARGDGLAAFTDGTGTISINVDGSIVGDDDGIRAQSVNGDISINTVGRITAKGIGFRGERSDGIFALTTGDGSVSINSTGDIDVVDSRTVFGPGAAIYAQSSGSRFTGNFGSAFAGGVAIASVGDLTARGTEMRGIHAVDYTGAGDIIVSSRGHITTYGASDSGGIYAQQFNRGGIPSQGAVHVDSIGDIKTNSASAISAGSLDGDVSVSSQGNLTTFGQSADGISAESRGNSNLEISSVGHIESTGVGIRAFNGNGFGMNSGTSIIRVEGSISTTGSGGVGIFSNHSSSGNVELEINGDITTQGSLASAILSRSFRDGDKLIKIHGTISSAQASGIDSVAKDGETLIELGSSASIFGGRGAGIDAESNGVSANIAIRGNSGTITGATDGVYLRTIGADITVDSIDSITGLNGNGIDADSGGGAIAITDVDTILGFDGHGILAISGGGDISIQSSGLVGGIEGTAESGIFAEARGVRGVVGGSIAIGTVSSIGNVTGDRNGIFARTAGTGSIVIDGTGGSIEGGQNGFEIRNYGSGEVRLSTANVTGGNGIGIYVRNLGGNLVIDSSFGSVSGGRYGILSRNLGLGLSTIATADVTTTGNIFGVEGDGIYSLNGASATDLTIDTTAGTIVGGGDGIFALQDGLADISIVTNGSGETRDDANKIDARNYGSGVLSIQTTNAAITIGDGISVANNVAGSSLVIDAQGPINSSTDGINATGGINTTDLTIVATGTVSGGDDGISALSSGSGDISVTAVDVTGTNGRGIYASNYDPAVFFNYGPTGGAVSVTATGDVVGGTTGIVAVGGGYGDVTVNAHNVTGTAQNGIFAGGGFLYGNVIINTTGLVSGGGYNNSGIWVSHAGSGDVTINSVDVTGGRSGIRAEASFGNVDVVSTGTVNSRVEGISGYTSYGSLSIEANNIYSSGTGANATFANAIHAENRTFGSSHSFSTATDITVNGTISGGNRGIFVDHIAADPVTITLGSSASVTGRNGEAISATTQGASITVQGNSGTITGATDGVYLRTSGADITVDTIDSITGLNGDGVDAEADGGDVIISNVDTVIGTGGNGVLAISDGGEISIQGNGLVGGIEGTTGDGILARGKVINIGGEALNGDITGSDRGIAAATGQVVLNSHITIDTRGATVTGGNTGILASNIGGGAISVTTGDVVGTNQDGIRVLNTLASTSITIDTSAGTVQGARYGIYARQRSIPELSISVADVTGATGIFADATRSGRSGGADIGITIASGAVVTGAADAGIYATTDSQSAISISGSGSVLGATDGLRLRNDSIRVGPVEVLGLKSIVGQAGDGIDIDSTESEIVIGGIETITGIGGYGISAVGGEISIFADGLMSSSGVAATVTGTNGAGIFADSRGAGGTLTSPLVNRITIGDFVSLGDVTGSTYGIRAISDGNWSMHINVDSRVSGGDFGIHATHLDRSVYVNLGANAVITGTNEAGIFASSAGRTVLEGLGGDVSGGTDGVYIRTMNSDISVRDLNSVTGNNGDGLDFDSAGGSININGIDTITASGGHGINFVSAGGRIGINGSGTVGGISSTTLDGIYANANGGRGGQVFIGSSVAIGDVTGARNGIAALANRGITIDSSPSSITGGRGAGIVALNGGPGDVVMLVGNVYGGTHGIAAGSTTGKIDITLGSTSVVEAANGVGIYASSTGAAADIIVQGNSGTITGATDGVYLRTSGADITVDTIDSITGLNGDGIDAASDGGAIVITDVDTIVGTGGNGILAVSGGGDISIQGSGLIGGITGTGGDGIFADARGGGSINIGGVALNGDIAGASSGVEAITDGVGGIVIDTSAATVMGSDAGIDARNYGSGTFSITTAEVTSTGLSGIFAINHGSSTMIDTTAGTITGDLLGIDARSYGSGAAAVITGDVNGLGSTGVFASNRGTSLTIDTSAGTINGQQQGVDGRNYGSGELSIATADVTSTRSGVFASNQGTSIDIDTTAGLVDGGYQGVDARNYGSGALTITTGDVTGAGRTGIDAINQGTDITIDSSAGSVIGASTGISARNIGSGSVAITTADVSADSNIGVFASTVGTSADIAVDTVAGTVSAGTTGILVSNGGGTGDVSVITADVLAMNVNGISINNSASGSTFLNTTAGAVQGGNEGINISASNAGPTEVLTADVSSGTGDALALFTGDETVVDTTAGTVFGGRNGIALINLGAGTAELSTGDVSGLDGDAILVLGFSDGISIDSTQGNVVGADIGIRVAQQGTGIGSVTIRTAGVTGSGGAAGIYAISTGIDLLIDSTAGDIAGQDRGILAQHSGTGAVTITTANVNATVGDGILAINSANGTDLTIDSSAGSVNGPYDGVEAFNYGSGALSITTADVTSSIDHGIYARNDGTSLSIDSSAGAVTGGTEGIFARQNGTGTLAITVNYVAGLGGAAIDAASTNAVADITVQGAMGDAVGATDGMYLRTVGADITVDNFATVEGQAGDGIDAASGGGAIAISNIKTVLGTGGNGITADSDGGAIAITNVGTMGGVAGTDGFAILADASSTTGTGGEIGIVAAGDITGSLGGISATTNDANITIDSSESAVSGANAILASTDGSGSIEIISGDVTSSSGDGIYAVADGSGVTIDSSAGSVSGYANGIFAQDVSGVVSVTSADVTGTTNGSGIVAQGNGGVSVDSSAGTVSGAFTGVFAQEFGSGDVEVTTANVVATGFDGVYASSNDGDIVIDSSAGNVSAGRDGVGAASVLGNISIAAAGVTGAANGIMASTAGDIDVDLTIGAVITGRAAAGIKAQSIGGSVAVEGSASDVFGATDALDLDTDGGVISVQGLRNVEGSAGDGIDANSNGGSISIASIDSVTGTGANGITANSGGGPISITSVGAVSGTGGDGIYAASGDGDISIQGSGLAGGIIGAMGSGIRALSNNGDIAIGNFAANGDVQGTIFGIEAFADGTGSVAIDTSTGTVTGGAEGIRAFTAFGSGSIAIMAADVTGGINGIVANTGVASEEGIVIDTSVGTVSAGSYGIYAANGGPGSIDITTADVTGTDLVGISANNYGAGTGAVLINTSAGSIVGGSAGISANSNGSGDIALLVGDVTGGTSGIITRAQGGTTSIALADMATVTGIGATAITAQSAGGDIAVQGAWGTAVGASDGILIRTNGGDADLADFSEIIGQSGDGIDIATSGGAIAVEGVKSILGTGGNGLLALSGDGDISIQGNGLIGGITGTGSDGIHADARGGTGGNINIGGQTTNGSVTGSITGIFARTGGAGGITIDSSAAGVIGGVFGIRATDTGNGAIDIVTADVIGEKNTAIVVRTTDTSAADISIDSLGGTVSGLTGGIDANAGTGSIAIVTADVILTSSDGGRAIHASSHNGDIAIDTSAGTVTGFTGIVATARGANAISVTTADVIGSDVPTSSIGYGVILESAGGGIVLDSTAGSISAQSAIYMRDTHGGAVNVITADVISSGHAMEALLASSNGGGVTIDTTAGTVSSAGNGVGGLERGAGAVTITTANVSGMGAYGVSGRSYGGGVTINTTAGTVSAPGTVSAGVGALAAIHANDRAGGDVMVTSADVVGTGGIYGIFAASDGGSVTVDSSAGSVSSYMGIKAEGAGPVNIVTADVSGVANFTGIGGFGIVATSASGITVDSSAGTVSGDDTGIIASNDGMGGVSISVASVTGGNTGIHASNTGAGQTTITTLGDVTGTATSGIMVDAGNGDLLLNIGGNVTGGENGIVTVTQSGTQLTVAEGQTISGGSVGIATMASGGNAASNDVLNILGTVDGAIMTFEGDDTVTLAEGGTVNGAVMLGDGADTLNFDGATVGALRGGDGFDTLNFNTGAGLFENSGDASTDGIAEFEVYNFNVGGFALGGTHLGLSEVNFNVGDSILMGSLSSLQTNIAVGATLQVADASVLNGSLSNAGTLGLNAGGFGALTINGNFAQTSDGSVTFDVLNGANFDQIVVSGDVDLAGTLNIDQPLPIGQTVTLIDGGAGLSGTFDEVTGLFDGLLINQSIAYDTAAFDVNLVAQIVDATTIGGVSSNQGGVANILIGEFIAGNLTGDIENLAIGLAMVQDSADLSSLLDELSPEIAGAGIDGIRLSQDYFLQSLLSRAWANGGTKSTTLSRNSRSPAPIGGAFGLASDKTDASGEGAVIWGAVSKNDHRNDSTINNIGYQADGIELTTGISDIDLASWKVGFAAGYTDFDSRGLRGLSDLSSTNLLRLGVHASNEFGSAGFGGRVDVAVAYGAGETDLTMITGLGAAQTGTADIETVGAGLRFTLDGGKEDKWPLRPFVSVSYDSLSQDATVLQGGGATDLALDAIDLERFTFGYGVDFVQDWGNTSLRLGATGYHYTGDTQVAIASRFSAIPGASGAFTTVGFNIENQWQFDAGISQGLGDDWTVSAEGYVGTGDIESYGGMLKVSKRF